MASAWGDSWASAWGDAWGSTPTVVVAEGGGGGILHVGRTRTREQVRAERERVGILPQRVQQVIRQVALETTPQNAEADLRCELEAANRTYKALYAEILRREMQRLQDDEEEALLLLM